METRTFKVLLFMRRRPDLSVEAFSDYYETRHVPLCQRHASGMTRYIRRRVCPGEALQWEKLQP